MIGASQPMNYFLSQIFFQKSAQLSFEPGISEAKGNSHNIHFCYLKFINS